jgi:hypothetical protein
VGAQTIESPEECKAAATALGFEAYTYDETENTFFGDDGLMDEYYSQLGLQNSRRSLTPGGNSPPGRLGGCTMLDLGPGGEYFAEVRISGGKSFGKGFVDLDPISDQHMFMYMIIPDPSFECGSENPLVPLSPEYNYADCICKTQGDNVGGDVRHEGDIRLQDCVESGPDAGCCRLEIQHEGQWGTVCDDVEDEDLIAQVACRYTPQLYP